MNFDVADDCRGAFQRAGGIFLSPETACIHPASQRGCGWFDGQSIQTDLPGKDFKEFKSDRRRTWLSVKT